MSQLYRFKFSSDHFAIELESTDPQFIDQKMRELINWSIEQGGDAPRLLAPGKPAYQSSEPEPVAEMPDAEEEAEALDTSMEQATEEEAQQRKRRGRGRPKGSTNKKAKRKTEAKKGSGKVGRPKKAQAKATVNKEVEDIEEVVDPKRIVEVAKNSDRFRKIKKEILSKSNQLNRILLAFHYARATYGDRGFSSGTIEEITKEFGKTIRRSNIAAAIKNNPDLFDSDQEPRRGITVKYELTPAGRKKIEDLIKD